MNKFSWQISKRRLVSLFLSQHAYVWTLSLWWIFCSCFANVEFLWDCICLDLTCCCTRVCVSSGAAGTQAMWCVIWRQSLCLQPLNIAPWCHGGFYPLPFSLCCCVICQLICPCQLSECRRGGCRLMSNIPTHMCNFPGNCDSARPPVE